MLYSKQCKIESLTCQMIYTVILWMVFMWFIYFCWIVLLSDKHYLNTREYSSFDEYLANDLGQDFGFSVVDALELLQCCTKPSMLCFMPALLYLSCRPSVIPVSCNSFDMCKSHAWCLMHLCHVLYRWIIELGHHWFRQWLGTCLVPSHYLNKNWPFSIRHSENKLQENLKLNAKLFLPENGFENSVCKMSVILFSSWDD